MEEVTNIEGKIISWDIIESLSKDIISILVGLNAETAQTILTITGQKLAKNSYVKNINTGSSSGYGEQHIL